MIPYNFKLHIFFLSIFILQSSNLRGQSFIEEKDMIIMIEVCPPYAFNFCGGLGNDDNRHVGFIEYNDKLLKNQKNIYSQYQKGFWSDISGCGDSLYQKKIEKKYIVSFNYDYNYEGLFPYINDDNIYIIKNHKLRKHYKVSKKSVFNQYGFYFKIFKARVRYIDCGYRTLFIPDFFSKKKPWLKNIIVPKYFVLSITNIVPYNIKK